MAKVKEVRKTEKKVVTMVPDGVVMELTQGETNFLYRLLVSIGGSPEGPRRNVNSIIDALKCYTSYDKKDMGLGSYPKQYNLNSYVGGKLVQLDGIQIEE